MDSHSDGSAVSPSPVGMILREKKPVNLEFPFWTLDGPITPGDRFFVRTHFPDVPALDRQSWRLKVEGAGIERPLELSYDELLRMPSRTVTATLECAGNGRVFLTPKVSGAQWEMGAVGTARWTGVPLRAVLERAGLRDTAAAATEAMLEGADTGEIKDEPKSPGKIPFARSIPLSKALDADTLLAYRMNDEDLPPRHGFPLRAVVPGWYGMASVKWLTRIVTVAHPFTGYFQSADYSYWEREEGLPIQMKPVTRMEVKAQIARPAREEVVPAGSVCRVQGAAWAGEAQIARVAVSADGGRTWSEARLLGEPVPHAWRLWEYDWQTPSEPGRRTLLTRATDSAGNTQPMERDEDRGTYVISHVLPVEVIVR